jgi:3-oxoacyl-[acyl-carrier protein] reductase
MLADDTIVDQPPVSTAIVTGGASGIGKATCELLARDGYLVAVADSDEVGARAVADACGGFAIAVDVADPGSVETAFARAFETLGERLDGLVTTANVVDATPFLEASPQRFRALHDVNVLGTYFAIRAAARLMQPGARICTVAAGASAHPAASAAEAACRGGVIEVTRAASNALAPRGIAVNGVATGAPRSGEPEIAEAVVWLLSPRASSIKGAIVTLDGG